MPNSPARYTYENLLSSLERSQAFGFLSPQPLENQIKHSVDFISLLPKGIKRALDLGSGGGLPSLVWLQVDPEIEIVALDAMNKRTNFLTEIASEHPCIRDRFEVTNGRAEILAHESDFREQFEVVVARGFGPPATTAECGSGYLKPGGQLFVSGRPNGESERWDQSALSEIGLEFESVLEVNETHVARLTKIVSLDEKYPRSSKALKKTPLW